MTNTYSKTFIIASHPLQLEIEGYRQSSCQGYCLGCFSSLFEGVNDHYLDLSLETLTLGKASPDFFQNRVVIRDQRLEITGSDMNTQAVYYIQLPGQFVVFNDLLIARDVLQQLGLPVDYLPENDDGELIFFRNLKRLKAGETLTVTRNGATIQVRLSKFSAILDQPVAAYSLVEAKERFYEQLHRATAELVKGEDEVYLSLSGGIDSGTILYFVKQLGKKVHAYTVGTKWGNEYREAQETAAFLGVDLVKIELSEEEILREIPNVIRYFGFTNPVSIEIAMVAFCLYQKLNYQDFKPMTFVTGYGSDLLNAGIYRPFNHPEELAAQILNGLKRTQLSNEFSNLAALNLGIKTLHPFWCSNVIQEALKVPAQYKVVDGKDKYFFRSMMEARVPPQIAWRCKKGAHQGTGLMDHLKAALVPNAASVESKQNEYVQIIKDIHRSIFLYGKYPVEIRDYTAVLSSSN